MIETSIQINNHIAVLEIVVVLDIIPVHSFLFWNTVSSLLFIYMLCMYVNEGVVHERRRCEIWHLGRKKLGCDWSIKFHLTPQSYILIGPWNPITTLFSICSFYNNNILRIYFTPILSAYGRWQSYPLSIFQTTFESSLVTHYSSTIR